jgi:hypothetical protein
MRLSGIIMNPPVRQWIHGNPHSRKALRVFCWVRALLCGKELFGQPPTAWVQELLPEVSNIMEEDMPKQSSLHPAPEHPDPFKAVGKVVGPYESDQVQPGQHDPNMAPRTQNQPVDGESDQQTAGNQNPGGSA